MTHDAIVLGAGHNGLAAAARLARAGKRVVLVERRAELGGLAALEEFHPGFRVPGLQHGTACFQEHVVEALDLHNHGLAWRSRPAEALAPEPDGTGLVFTPGDDALPRGLADRSPEDATAWRAWRAFLADARGLVRDLLARRPPEVRGGLTGLLAAVRPALALRRLGPRGMTELLRAVPMAVEDHLSEYFRDPLLKAFLASRAIEGGFLGPRSAGTTALLLMRECGAGRGVRGGPSELTEVLATAAKSAGATLRTECEVTAISVEKGSVRGVELAGGEKLEAPLVLSATGVARTLLELVPTSGLPSFARYAARHIRARGSTAAVRLALDSPLRWNGREDETFEHARVAACTDDLERAFDRVKHKLPCEAPWLDVYVASAERPELAPEGAASVSVLVHCAAGDLDWTDDAKRALRDKVVRVLDRHATASGIAGEEVLSPTDLRERYALDGGHPHHADLGLDQLFLQRPSPRLSHYATPVRGLFLAGRATHPGSEFLGASGVLAADAALEAR